MSMRHKEKITCPECGHAQDIIIWKSLNGKLNPKEKQQLLDGTLFRFECKKCGHISNVDYYTLYHDMTHHAMVYYVDENSVEQALKTMIDAEKTMGFEMPDYRKRIVTDQNSLREKAIIFDHGLDDRVIEIIKLIYYMKACEQFPESNIKAVYFLVMDDKYILEFIGDKPLSAEIPADMYDNTKSGFAEKLDAAGDKEAVINIGWASRFLKSE